MQAPRKPYVIRAVYDTETSNVMLPVTEDGITISKPIAYPVLYILNKLTTGIEQYEPELCDEVLFYRTPGGFFKFIEELIEEAAGEFIPIVCTYNLMFDLQPVIHELRKRYPITVNAQSSRNAYTVDLLDPDLEPVLRFWDTSHLEPRGLRYMGEAAGFEKATGDWDYTLIRTPETPLTDLELHYAKRDVQVIPAYLKYILDTNQYLDPGDLGNKIVTKTSIVRQMAKHIIGPLQVPSEKGGTRTLEQLMRIQCRAEAPRDYHTYATRKACFRGGLTFTAANYASKLHTNVVSVDAVSMHHAHINGAHVWCKFTETYHQTLKRMLDVVRSRSLDRVLEEYERPFPFGFHAHVRIYNLRPKKDSVFERAGIWTLAEAKCSGTCHVEGYDNPRGEAAEAEIKKRGYTDAASGTEESPRVFAYSKLVSAAVAEVYVTEIEWWILCQVYDMDKYEVLEGESTTKTCRPPEYVTLLSNMLYNQKDELKKILKTYKPGEPYNLTDSRLPKHVQRGISTGEYSKEYLESYYKNIIKGSYNAIYGSQAQDVYKPNYTTDETGNLIIDESSISAPDNFAGASSAGLVWYTYGMRIVGRSRMHLVIAIMLLDRALGNRISILGGDTDSLKISTDPDVSDADIIEALAPLHRATKEALDYVQQQSRENYPELTSSLDHLGEYEIETYAGGKFSRYKYMIESWNKCRLAVDQNDMVHITCAGVSRPEGVYNLEDLATDMLAKYGLEVLDHILAYNTFFDPSISYLLEHNNPAPDAVIDMDIEDYLGNVSHVHSYQSIALDETGKTIGDTFKIGNMENICYKKRLGENIDQRTRDVWIDEKSGYILLDDGGATPKLYKVNRG